MRRPGQQDVLIVITSPTGVADPRTFSPFDAPHPDELVFCCFFRTLEQRADFLKRTREIAATSLVPEEERAARNESLAEEYVRLHHEGKSGDAFLAAIRWWTGVMRRGYHAYSLKIGFAPYRTSCIVAFREMDTDALRHNLARALQFLEREKTRVLDFFGLGGRN